MRIKREELLKVLESVVVGIDKTGQYQQSNCFVFGKNRISTFNEHMTCSVSNPLDGIVGAVQAMPLLSLLRKLTDDVLDVKQGEGGLLVRNMNKQNVRKSCISMDAEITSPVGDFEKADKWAPLPDGFEQAVSVASSCTSHDKKKSGISNCVHISPEWMEASDNNQLSRYLVDTGIEVLVLSESIESVLGLELTEWGLTPAWLHFRNSSFEVSCRRQLFRYPDLTAVVQSKGVKTKLPTNIGQALDKCKIFTEGNSVNGSVMVSLVQDEIRMEGKGPDGWYREVQTEGVKYSGPEIKFMISPKILLDITHKSLDCEVGSGRLIVRGKNFTYVTSTTVVGM
jgi:hypothetical protein